MRAVAQRWPAQPPSVPGLPPRPVVMWAPYRYGVFSWLQSQDQQIAETVAFLRGEIMQGVTDGSDARPGEIGEFIRLLTPPFAVPLGSQTQSVTLGTLPAGDWDVWASMVFADAYAIAEMQLSPKPAGFVDNLFAQQTGDGTSLSGNAILTSITRALTAQASTVVFSVTTEQIAPGVATTAEILFNARRRR